MPLLIRLARHRQTLHRVLAVLVLLVVYRLVFWPVHDVVGSAAFLMALVPCAVSGLLLGVRGALLTIIAVVVLDRSQALALGMSRDAGFVASVLLKTVVGLGLGLVSDHARRTRQLNQRLLQEQSTRQRAEAKVAASEHLYRSLVESLGEGVGLFDRDDRFTFANAAMARTLGVPAPELLQRQFAHFLDDESRQRMLQAEQEGDNKPVVYEAVLSGERPRLLLVTETLVNEDNNGVQQTLRVVRDITESAEAERKRRTMELELQKNHALQSMAVLAGGVAHDFNNLLSGIIGNAELALLKLPHNSSPKLGNCLSEIKGFAQEASQLSRQMLAYAGRRNLSIGNVDLNLEIQEALRLLKSTTHHRAQLEVELEQTLPPVLADGGEMRQVLTNLVINATEAISNGRGMIRVRTSSEDLSGEDLLRHAAPNTAVPGPFVCLSVEDDGAGMSEDTRRQIFEPFFSTKAGVSRGMGLAASEGIVRANRGWLTVESSPGRGARFCVWLPSAEPQSTSAPTAPLSGTRRSNSADSVLLIDDEPAVRLVTAKLLTELGQKVATADSGQRGVELFSENHRSIDTVLLDLTMPDLSGLQVLDALRAIDPNVQVVLTSGFIPNDGAALGNRRNVVGFLEKPHTLEQLEGLLGTRLPHERQSWLAQSS